MLILIVDTAGTDGGILLARAEDDSSMQSEPNVLGIHALEPRKFSQQLIAVVGELLRTNDVTVKDVDVFAMVSGPGSFTGLRVGISAVKAMAEVTQKPVVALSRLAALASAFEISSLQKSAGGTIHAVFDAGRNEFYHGIYRDRGLTCIAESLETVSTLQESVKNIPGPIVVSETAVLESLKTIFEPAPCILLPFSVREVLPLAISFWHAQRFTDVAALDANYLRRMVPKIN